MKYEMDFSVKQVRNFTILILIGTISMTVLTLIVGPWAFEKWYLAMYFMGCFGAVITAALMVLDKRLKAIEKKLDERD